MHKQIRLINTSVKLFKPNHNINTVVFDLYETIIFPKQHLRPAPIQAFINTFNYYGFFSSSTSILLNDNKYDKTIDPFINIVNKYMGISKKEHLKRILNEPYVNQFYNSIKTTKHCSLDDIYNKFIDIQCDILSNPDYCTLSPNYLETEEKLRILGIKYFCFTTGFNHQMTSIIFHHLPQLTFNKIITSDSVQNPRPNPEGIYSIMKKYDLYDYNIIKVGDTIADIQEANNASVISVGITTGSVDADTFRKNNADYIISDIICLPEIIKLY